jgi:hypothetical protein
VARPFFPINFVSALDVSFAKKSFLRQKVFIYSHCEKNVGTELFCLEAGFFSRHFSH